MSHSACCNARFKLYIPRYDFFSDFITQIWIQATAFYVISKLCFERCPDLSCYWFLTLICSTMSDWLSVTFRSQSSSYQSHYCHTLQTQLTISPWTCFNSYPLQWFLDWAQFSSKNWIRLFISMNSSQFSLQLFSLACLRLHVSVWSSSTKWWGGNRSFDHIKIPEKISS